MKKLEAILEFIFIFCLSLLIACSPSHRDLVEKADQDVLNQRSLLAKYLYAQVVKEHKRKDDIRYRALKGLADVSLTQTFEYPVAVTAMENIISDFTNDPQFRGEIPDWRRKLAGVFRLNMQNPRKSKEVLLPLLAHDNLSVVVLQEMGRTFLALNEFSEAEAHFKKAWTNAIQQKNCSLSRELQMDMIQTYSLSKRCDRAIEWTEQKLPTDCAPDRLALALEKSNCLEISGDTSAAMKIYEDLIRENPKNMRAHFLLQSMKNREKEKKIK